MTSWKNLNFVKFIETFLLNFIVEFLERTFYVLDDNLRAVEQAHPAYEIYLFCVTQSVETEVDMSEILRGKKVFMFN